MPRGGFAQAPVPRDDGTLDLAQLDELAAALGQAGFDALFAAFSADLETRLACLRARQAGAGDAGEVLHALSGSAASIGAAALAGLGRELMHRGSLAADDAARLEASAAASLAALAAWRRSLDGCMA